MVQEFHTNQTGQTNMGQKTLQDLEIDMSRYKISPASPVLAVLEDRMGDPDFRLANSGCNELVLLNAPLERPRAWIEVLRDNKLECSSVPCVSMSSEAPGVIPA